MGTTTQIQNDECRMDSLLSSLRHCECSFRTATKSEMTLNQDITKGVIIIEANRRCPVIARNEAIQNILFLDCFVPRNDEQLPSQKQF
jgi:hypothetical protein